MYSLDDIRNITFTQAGRNKYSADEVDDFVDGCVELVEWLMKEKRALEQEKATMAGKMELLANKLVEYRQNEESISEALLSAQQAGRTIIREANQKAELILRDAAIKAEKVQETALREIKEEEKMLQEVKQKVSDFKAMLLELYREHLKQIDLLPETPPEEAPADVEDADDAAGDMPTEPTEPEEPAEPETPAEEAPAEPTAEEQPEEDSAEEPVVVAVSQEIEPEETEDDPKSSRFPKLQFGEDYEPLDEPKRGLFGRKKP